MSKIRNTLSILFSILLFLGGIALAVIYFALWNLSNYLTEVNEFLGDLEGEQILLLTAIGLGLSVLFSVVAYFLTLDRGRKRRPYFLMYFCFLGLSCQLGALAGVELEKAVTLGLAVPAIAIVGFGPPFLIFPLEALLRRIFLWPGHAFLRLKWYRLSIFFLHKAMLFKPGDEILKEYVGQAMDRSGGREAARELLLPLVREGRASETSIRYLAEGYEKDGELEQAISLYNMLRERHPDDTMFLNKLTQLYLESDQVDKAIPLVEEQTNFESLSDLLRLEELYVREGNVDRVREILSRCAELEKPSCKKTLIEYRRVLKILPVDKQMILELADLCWEIDKRQEASDYYEQILLIEPENKEIRRKILDYYIENSQPERVEKHIEYLVQQGEISPLIIQEYAEMLIQKEDFDTALDELLKAKELYPDEYQFPHILSQLYYDRKDYDKARREMAVSLKLVPPDKKDRLQILYRKIEGAILNAQIKKLRARVKRKPKNIDLRFQLIDKLMANAYLERVTSEIDTLLYYHPDLKERVVKHIEQLTQKYERNYLLLDYLADMYLREKQLDKCMEIYEKMSTQSLDPNEVIQSCCEKILRVDPEYIPVLKKLGDLARDRKDSDAMIEYYLKCDKENPDSVFDRLEVLFDAFCENKSHEKAEEFGRRFLEKEPENVSFLIKFAKFLVELERYDEALDYLEKAQELKPEDQEIEKLRDDATRKRKQVNLDQLLERLEAEPDNSEVREQVGDHLSFFENYTDAVKHYQRAAQLSPNADLPRAKLALCLAKRGMIELAEETLEEIKLSLVDSPDQKDLKHYIYETAIQFEKEIQPQMALKYYKQIFRVDAAFRDVVKRIEKIENLDITVSPYGKKIRSKPRSES